jgi:hypothetical protein
MRFKRALEGDRQIGNSAIGNGAIVTLLTLESQA